MATLSFASVLTLAAAATMLVARYSSDSDLSSCSLLKNRLSFKRTALAFEAHVSLKLQKQRILIFAEGSDF